MEAWAVEFLEVFRARKVQVAEAFLKGTANNPDLPIKYTYEDMIQMTDGFIAMISETLDGKSSEIWDTYMNSVIPGILAQGQPLPEFVGGVAVCAVIFFSELTPHVSEQNREKAATFAINWYSRFISEIVRIGTSSGVNA